MLSGKRRLSEDVVTRLRDWIDGRSVEAASFTQTNPVPIPIVSLHSPSRHAPLSSLGIAMEYLRRGWSVIPQIPGQKQPPIRWKEYQDRVASEAEMLSWWTRWPDAGIALIAGPLSGILVIDVDSEDAHRVLTERLGGIPNAPAVRSGSNDPHRYHLFFKHPAVRTKAKATPWHPKLEFRGHRGLAVLPPSMHKSGNRYVWLDGRSLNDLDIPDLPAAIVDALTPVTPVLQRAATVPSSRHDVSPSTEEFLRGVWADGPNWNDRLFKAACDLHARGFGREEAVALLVAGAHPLDGTEADQVGRTIESAFSHSREPSHI